MLKHRDNLESKDKVKYDLYKILRMSILLNPNEIDREALSKFKDAAIKIDEMLSEIYDEKLEDMFYNTTTLEEEEKRLKNLIVLINERIEERKNLIEDYTSVTNRDLDDLEYINKAGEVDSYESRLKSIKDYTENSKLIKLNEEDLEILKENLVKEYDVKSSNEIKNTKLEDTLHNNFINILYDLELYKTLISADIDDEIEELRTEIKDAQDQKDTFEQAFNNLKSSGISGELELEYASYVENAKNTYYSVKEKEIIFRLYKLFDEKKSEYVELYQKRASIKELLQERLLLRKQLNIKGKDLMSKLLDVIEEQSEEIESEKVNIDNINILTEKIKLKENRLEELNRDIRRPEVLSLLKEYALIETYNHDDDLDTIEDLDAIEEVTFEEEQEEEEIPEQKEIVEEIEEEEQEELALDLLKDLLPEEQFEEQEENVEIPEPEVIEKTYQPNEIKESLTVPTMNFGLSRLKSISVMKRVADMLGVNARKELKKEEIIAEIPKENKVIEETPVVEQTQKDDMFWTPVEFMEMKNDIETNDNIQKEEPIFEFKMPEMKETQKEEQIFATEPNNGLIFPETVFPEPAMPDAGQNILPENKEDKFMWPENMESFDINGIFPN